MYSIRRTEKADVMQGNREFRNIEGRSGGGWPSNMSDAERPKLHRELQQLRLARRIGVRELSGLLGYSTFSMVSDVEAGCRRVPPAKLVSWALAVGMDPRRAAEWWLEENCPELARVLLAG